jgi:hypothetical protein
MRALDYSFRDGCRDTHDDAHDDARGDALECPLRVQMTLK